ncbi:hypothetical protein [Streptomyces sp. NBC_01546]|uniref:hypothetical protein n=1 Tax=Streptomyces sp. NBC_01546 TaxID=2975872 RepID=UPI003864F8B4
MANEPDTTPIHNLYAQRFAADLETNRKEQEVVSSQIAELDVRLKQLKEDESWLCGIQGALPAAAAEATTAQSPAEDTGAVPAASAEAAVAGTVPKPRRARQASGGTARGKKATQSKNPSGSAAPADAKAKAKTTTRKPATAAAQKATEPAASPKAAEPPLRELVLALLVSVGEPRLVSEVATELAQAHPARPASTQVVRNTLEALVKKGAVEKEHKQGSVMYTVPQPAAAEPTGEAVPASDATEEKVSADV